MSESSFAKGFGVTTGILVAIFCVAVGIPVLTCGGCLLTGSSFNKSLEAAKQAAAQDLGVSGDASADVQGEPDLGAAEGSRGGKGASKPSKSARDGKASKRSAAQEP